MYYVPFTFKNMRGWKSEPSFLSLNCCLVPALAFLAYCPLRTRSRLEALNGKKQHKKKAFWAHFSHFQIQKFVASAHILSFFSFSWSRGFLGGRCSWSVSWRLQMGRSWIFYSRALMSHDSLRKAAAVTSWFLLDFQTCWKPTVTSRVQRQLLPVFLCFCWHV